MSSGPTVYATIIVATGLQANLPSSGTVGTPYFCTDTGNLYVWNGTSMVLVNSAFSGILSGTNTGTLVIGTGGSLSVSGSGTITATGLTGTPNITVGTVTAGTLSATTIDGAALSGTFTGSATLSGNIAFTGTPTFSNPLALGSSTATTQTAGTNNTTIATTAFTLGQGFVTALTAPVTSVFGRTGVVVAATNDYAFPQISGVISVAQLPSTGTWNFAGSILSSGNITFTGELTDSFGSTGFTGQVLSSTSISGSPPGGSVKWVYGDPSANFNVKNYGAKGNTLRVTDGITNTSGNTVSSASYSFTQADVGKAIYAVHNNTPAFSASSTIASVTGGVATIAGTVAHTNASGCVVVFGHDDTVAIQAAVTAANAAGATIGAGGVQLYFPAGGYWLGGSTLPAINVTSGNVDLVGSGISETVLFVPPDFPYSATGGANVLGITGSGATSQQTLRDLTLDGSTGTFSTSNAYLVSTGGVTVIRNFRMQNFQATGGINGIGSNATVFDNVQLATFNGIGLISLASGIDQFLSNCSLISTTNFAFATQQNPIIHASNCLFQGSTEGVHVNNSFVQFSEYVNCTILGTTVGLNCVSSGSNFKLVNCKIQATTPINIASGTTVSAGNCYIISNSTVAVANAGTFNDLGGNAYTGLISNTGSVLGNAYVVSKDKISGEQSAIPSGSPPSSNILYAVPSNGQGYYEISYIASITGAAGVSSTLGGSNGFQVSYTNGNGGSATNTTQAGTTSNANTVGTALTGTILVYAAASSNINYSFGYTSSGSPLMTYDLAVTVVYKGI